MTEKNVTSSPGKDAAAFIGATVCAAPFIYIVTDIFIDHQGFSQSLVLSVFFSPLMLLATIVEPIFIVLAWIKSPHWCKPFLILYLFAIATYWTIIAMSGSW